MTNDQENQIDELKAQGYGSRYIAEVVLGSKSKKSTVNDYLKRKKLDTAHSTHLPKVLVFDIETAPIKAYVWGLWQNNVGLNMINSEWFVLSYAAKWLGAGENEVYYNDLRGVVAEEDDKFLIEEMWELLNDADIVITQNGKRFDVKKLNARFLMHGLQPPSSFKHIDTLEIAKANFAFTSNKLEWMTDKLNVDFKKLKHSNFAGFELWKGMLNDDPEAWKECEQYNKHDVFSLEELYIKLAAWDKKHPNFSLYFDEPIQKCRCGGTDFIEEGYAYTSVSKFQRYRCNNCGAESRSRKNLFTKEKRESITMNVM